MSVINMKCGMDRDAYKEYTSLAEVEEMYADNLERRVQNFSDCLAFVACIDCLECENQCKLFEMTKADLDDLYRNDNKRFYSYLCMLFEALSESRARVVKD